MPQFVYIEGPTLGGDATAGQTFSASQVGGGSSVNNLFDDNSATDFSNGTDNTFWVTVQFSSAKAIGRYSITATNSADYDRMPITWTLKASNTGLFAGEEVTIDTQSVPNWAQAEKRTYDVVNTTDYTYYQFNGLTKLDALGRTQEYVMAEMEMMAYT